MLREKRPALRTGLFSPMRTPRPPARPPLPFQHIIVHTLHLLTDHFHECSVAGLDERLQTTSTHGLTNKTNLRVLTILDHIVV